MIIRQFLHQEPVGISYLFGCGGRAAGAVVDPVGEIEPYIRAAEAANMHNCCQAFGLPVATRTPSRKTGKNRAGIMKNRLFDHGRRFNGNVPRNSQGESRGDFWTVQDNLSRKETRPGKRKRG